MSSAPREVTGRGRVPGPDPAWARTAAVVWPSVDEPGRTAAQPARRRRGPADPLGHYRLVRFEGRVRFVVAAELGRRARRAVLRYGNDLRSPSRRWARRLVGSWFLLGARDRVGDLVEVPGDDDALGLRTAAAAALGCDEEAVHLSFAVIDREGSARPTVLVSDGRGHARLFLKVGAGAARRAALERERDATAVAAARSHRGDLGVVVPRPVLLHRAGAGSALGMTPLPDDVTPVDAHDPAPTWRVLDRLVAAGPTTATRLGESPWLRRLLADARGLRDGEGPHGVPVGPVVAHLGRRSVEMAAEYHRHHGDAFLLHGLRHGDWSPWNLGWTGAGARRRLVAWDWEFGEAEAPVALDRHNWHFARATSVDRVAAGTAAADLLERSASDHPGELGTSPLTARLFLLDMAVRRALLAAAGEQRAAEAAAALLDVLAADID
ncbi:hypothetical protein [Nocardioides zeae]|uniref:Uncharacterized protein n=1 Tax=Nocardioides zeae TaxID=1457234 RepID=A0AAJ1TYY4_9ACTN|nr:hypothetical protein [Nocardioides zeae]MDQ1104570.1 hypothetical protein [Nocardioides zeae]